MEPMISHPNYQILELLHESHCSLIYRGRQDSSQRPIILKTMKNPSPKQISRFQHEYKVIRSLSIEGVIKAYALERDQQNNLIIVLEDFGGESLKKKFFTPLEFLPLALQIVDILGKLHQHDVLHNNINPSNLIWKPENSKEIEKPALLKLIGFEISTQKIKERPLISSPNSIEGTLAYISPEQTGRMNRLLDYRSDYYSLGVTFYELLTGRLPFPTKDPMELTHCHLVKMPLAPHEICPELPHPLSKIILKLMSKYPEDRYQSTRGIYNDLKFCLEKLQTSKSLIHFSLGQNDFSEKFQIPQKLYGREKETRILFKAFERVSQGSAEMMLLSGYSGIGKSVLAHELQKLLIPKKGYFISGKFDRFQQDTPYLPIIQAFQDLVRQLLTESESQLAFWKNKLQESLGSSGQIIIEVIPEIELIIGKQPLVTNISLVHSQNRFHRIFKNFVRVFAQPEHPLILFLENLQWLDWASLKWIQQIMTQRESHSLFLIGAYRDQEVLSSEELHPLLQVLEEIQKAGAMINQIHLSPLNLKDVTQLVTDTLRGNTPTEQTQNFYLQELLDRRFQPLASFIFQKTQGNPFLTHHFFQSLYEKKLLSFDYIKKSWQWNLHEVEISKLTDTARILMEEKIKKLPEKTQELLQLASCIGNQFNLSSLSVANDSSPEEIHQLINPAIQEEILLPVYTSSEEVYQFFHDQIQQTAYSMIKKNQKQEVHSRIGRKLLQRMETEGLFEIDPANFLKVPRIQEKIFDLVNQLGAGGYTTYSIAIRQKLAWLNYHAGKKAKNSMAHQSALHYFHCGLELLEIDSWKKQYELTLALYTEAVETHYLQGNYEEMDPYADIVLQEAKTILDRIKIHEIQILMHNAKNQFGKAVHIGIQTLKILGIQIFQSPSKELLEENQEKIQAYLEGNSIQALIDLPQSNNYYHNSAMRIMSKMTASASVLDYNLYTLLGQTMVLQSIEKGNTSFSIGGYLDYATSLSHLWDDLETGYEFGRISLSLLKEFNTQEMAVETQYMVNTFHRPWKEHFKNTLSSLLETYQNSLEIGEFSLAASSLTSLCVHFYCVGSNLAEVDKKIVKYLSIIKSIKMFSSLEYLKPFRQFVLNLLGKSSVRHLLIGESYNEEVTLPILLEKKNYLLIIHIRILKLTLCYLFAKYSEALENIHDIEKDFPGISPRNVRFFYYNSLTRFALIPLLSLEEQNKHFQIIEENQKKLQRWSGGAPMNFQHQWFLVEAEKAKHFKNDPQAIQFYKQAIQGARKYGYVQDEALSCELYAKFWFDRDDEEIAQLYLTKARHLYQLWGATAKVVNLEESYPQWLTKQTVPIQPSEQNSFRQSVLSGSKSDSNLLDLATIMKTSQTISSEIILGNLLKTLMKHMIENAGAEKGFLILKKDGDWWVEAEGAIEQEENFSPMVHLDSHPIQEGHSLSKAIIYYVTKTQESLVLENAAQDKRFRKDTYLIQYQPKSTLCSPILYQGKIMGLLYLENNLITGAFTKDRLEMLNLLSSQASISIKNAQLYASLEQKHQQLKEAQTQVVHSEKMASLGVLVAGVAHEVNNPMNFVYAQARYLEGRLKKFQETLFQLMGENADQEITKMFNEEFYQFFESLEAITEGSNRIQSIVGNLRTFSRVDEGEIKYASIVEGVKSTLKLITPQYRDSVNFICEFQDDPEIRCLPGQLNQVFMNMMVNASQAIQQKQRQTGNSALGTLTIKTWIYESNLAVSFQDTGCGMSPEVQGKMFDPFFTTKQTQEGTGLGLSITYGIIEKHGGEIKVQSTLGQGSIITLFLPLKDKQT